MSVQASGQGEEIYFLGVSEEDVEFDRLEGVLHGEYQQAIGTIQLDQDYDVSVVERDNTYMVQIRGEDGLVDRSYVRAENPYEELPESDEELYQIVREDILKE
jgi:hypothetical protein